MSDKQRVSTGIPRLDQALGGGLIPGTLTMVIGATGVGKTQLGMQLAYGGLTNSEAPGAVIDLSSRGDSQNHWGYAQRMFESELSIAEPETPLGYCPFEHGRPSDVLPFLGYGGRRVLRSQMDVDQWHAWQSELNRRTPWLFQFVYGHLVHGTRRFIIDGVEPQESASDSLQLDLLELVYHRMLRKEHDWLAREVFRERYRQQEERVAQHAYDHQASVATVLVTTKQSMLDQLIAEPLADGDLAAGANTVILMGRILSNGQMGRGIYIAKHRGSFADSRVLPFDIDDAGIQLPA